MFKLAKIFVAMMTVMTVVTTFFGLTANAADDNNSLGKQIAEYASSDEFLGIPYEWGGDTKAAFDCSGFVMYVYREFGYDLPHYTLDLKNLGTSVSYDELEAGDLVFFYSDYGHVGIYIGDYQVVHAGSNGITISSIAEGHYLDNYKAACRII